MATCAQAQGHHHCVKHLNNDMAPFLQTWMSDGILMPPAGTWASQANVETI